MNLTPHIIVAIKRHAYDLEGIGETVLASALVEWAKLLPESVSFTNLVQPEPSPKAHNPYGLTPEQVGVGDGWRLLDEDEVKNCPSGVNYLKSLEKWHRDAFWDNTGWCGASSYMTFRTKLSRAALAAARSATEGASAK